MSYCNMGEVVAQSARDCAEKWRDFCLKPGVGKTYIAHIGSCSLLTAPKGINQSRK